MPLPSLPSAILSSAFVDNLVVNAVKLYTVYSQAINTLITWGDSIGQGFVGEYSNGSVGVTLSGTGIVNESGANDGVVFTLTEQRRVRVEVKAVITGGSTTAAWYGIYALVGTGSTPGTGAVNVGDGHQGRSFNAGAQATGGVNYGSILLAAGTYIAYGGVQRVGGATSDVWNQTYVAVYDVGSV